MSVFKRDDFFKALGQVDLKPVRLHLPELGGDVFIKTLSAKEREHYEDLIKDMPKDGHNVRATIATQCVCDEDGNLLFEAGDVEALNQGSSKVLMRIFAKFNEVNGVSDEEVAEVEKK